MNLDRFGFILASGTLLALGALHYAGVTGNVTESEPIGLYLKVPGDPVRGGMVQCRGLIKHIAGVPGDVIRVTPEGSYINNKLWPNSAPVLETNRYRPYPFGTYTLQDGQYWGLGSTWDSFDSRYIGPLPSDTIAFNIAPLWTATLKH
jgi:type IV secretory pathway protease TraF